MNIYHKILFPYHSHASVWKQSRFFSLLSIGLWQWNVCILKDLADNSKYMNEKVFNLAFCGFFFFFLPSFSFLRKCAVLMLYSMPAHEHSCTERPVFSLNQNMDEKAAGWNWTWAIQNSSHSQGSFSPHLATCIHGHPEHAPASCRSPWLTASTTLLPIKAETSPSHLCHLWLSQYKVTILNELQPLVNFSLSL